MNISELRVALETYLAPTLAAQVQPSAVPCKSGGKIVASISPQMTAIKASVTDTQRLILYREPGFSPEELSITRDFVEELVSLYEATEPEYRSELLTFLPVRAITRHLGGWDAVGRILRQFDIWSARTYEGGAISSSIGIDPDCPGKDVTLAEIFECDFSAVISNGFDTLLVVTPDSIVSESGQLPANQLGLDYSPYRLNAIADWACGARIAFVLNRLGEQLVFKDRKLLFAKRRGEWQFYAHEMYLRQMKPPLDRNLREAIYQSCLDISYSRTGGCIIVVRSGSLKDVDKITSEPDRISGSNPSIKTKTICAMIGKSLFQAQDRRLRQELLALDGAMILDHEGNIIAVGAIISLPAGSEGGGRTAAAKNGSNLGLGIKISQDGAITVYKDEVKIFSV